MPKKLVSIRLSDEAIKELKRIATEQERSEAFIIEKLLLSKKAKQVKGKTQSLG